MSTLLQIKLLAVTSALYVPSVHFSIKSPVLTKRASGR